MGEFSEFAEALFGQLSVEIDEEKEILRLADNAQNDMPDVKFEAIEQIADKILSDMRHAAADFLGMEMPNSVRLEFLELDSLKRIKGVKVFSDEKSHSFVQDLFSAVADENTGKIADLMKQDTAKYLVYSTYAIQYISKISTTYGDYLDSTIYLNKFVLSRYPYIILHKQGPPYTENFSKTNSGYVGAIKMTILEETIHSAQGNLQKLNREAATQVNLINEELAKIILSLDADTVDLLTDYLQLQAVPDDFPFAKKANLFFFLNPDHFLIEQIGPDVMTYTHVEIDPKISQSIPQLLDIYKRWLVPIQKHHAAFTIMEGMAAFAVENILGKDADFGNYLSHFMGTDFSSYRVRKSIGRDFTKTVYAELGKDSFRVLIDDPPNTREIKDPQSYLDRITR